MKTLIATKKNSNWEIEISQTRILTITDIDINSLCQLFNIENPTITEEENKIIVKGD